MPNGYSAPIYEGKDITLQEFAASCARGMGYFLHQRDEGSSAKLRYPTGNGFDGDSYYARELPKAESEFLRWHNFSEEERYAEWSEYFRSQEIKEAEAIAKDSAMRARYDDMIAQVIAVDITNEPLMGSTKEFMLRMLIESRDFDCHDEPGKYYHPLEYVAWCNEQERKLKWDIDYYSEKLTNEEERNDERLAYIDSFVRTFGVKVIREG